MTFWVIHIPFLNVPGMALYPFVLVKKNEYKRDAVLINHELIHLRQQLELFILPFYVLYLLEYLINLFKYKNHNKAYFNISFEKEAYAKEQDLSYLKERSWYNWTKYC